MIVNKEEPGSRELGFSGRRKKAKATFTVFLYRSFWGLEPKTCRTSTFMPTSSCYAVMLCLLYVNHRTLSPMNRETSHGYLLPRTHIRSDEVKLWLFQYIVDLTLIHHKQALVMLHLAAALPLLGLQNHSTSSASGGGFILRRKDGTQREHLTRWMSISDIPARKSLLLSRRAHSKPCIPTHPATLSAGIYKPGRLHQGFRCWGCVGSSLVGPLGCIFTLVLYCSLAPARLFLLQ